MYYINVFFLYSIVGHILENLLYRDIDSGFLYGYWTPVYGIGAIVIIIIYKYINKLNLNKLLRILSLFCFSTVILTIMEYVGGVFIESTLGRIFWDYGNNLKYISFKMSIIWGICSLLFVYIIHPIINNLIKKIPKYITYILVLLLLFDLIYTFITIGDY